MGLDYRDSNDDYTDCGAFFEELFEAAGCDQEGHLKIKIEELEKRLSEIYWPIYLRLPFISPKWIRHLKDSDEIPSACRCVHIDQRSAGICDKDPICFDEPWPGVFEAKEGRLLEAQA